MSVEMFARTIEGECYIRSTDLAAGLRQRAAEFDAYAAELGEPLIGEDWTTAVSRHAVAAELRARADAIDFGVIAHLSEYPGDSTECDSM